MFLDKYVTLQKHKEIFEKLKEYKPFIGNIDKNYFFDLVDILFKEIDKLNKQLHQSEIDLLISKLDNKEDLK